MSLVETGPTPPAADEPVAHRLALGVEVIDALTERRLTTPVQFVQEDPPGRHSFVPHPPDRVAWLADQRSIARELASDGRRRRGGLPPSVQLLIHDPAGRYVARRLRFEFPPVDHYAGTEPWIARPRLFPGPAYGRPAGTTFVRGSVVREPQTPSPSVRPVPHRWARIAVDVGNRRFWGHADDAGDFLVLVEPPRNDGGNDPGPATLRVWLAPGAKDPPPGVDPRLRTAALVHRHPPVDPWWGLPVERRPADPVGQPAPAALPPDDVLAGSGPRADDVGQPLVTQLDPLVVGRVTPAVVVEIPA